MLKLIRKNKEKVKKVNIKDRLRGSGTLVVILSSVAFSIYAMSTFSEQEHYKLIQSRYEKDIKSTYEKNVDKISEYYENILNVQ